MAILPAGADAEFTCPECGSHYWGSDMSGGVYRGGCHGRGADGQACRFTWLRSNDSGYFKIRGIHPIAQTGRETPKGNP